MPDADVTVWQGLFDQEDSDAYLRELVENIAEIPEDKTGCH